MKKLLIPFIGFVLIFSFALAYQGVEGVVYKGMTSTVVPACTVALSSDSVPAADTAITDIDGYYRVFTDYPGGSNYIKAWIYIEEEEEEWESDWENVYIPLNVMVEKDIHISPAE